VHFGAAIATAMYVVSLRLCLIDPPSGVRGRERLSLEGTEFQHVLLLNTYYAVLCFLLTASAQGLGLTVIRDEISTG
jgi:hypothetical protein